MVSIHLSIFIYMKPESIVAMIIFRGIHRVFLIFELFRKGGCDISSVTAQAGCVYANLHSGDRGNRTGVSRKSGERSGGASLLDIVVGETSGKVCLAVCGLGDGDNVGAVDHLVHILAKDSELSHSSLERVLELRLVICKEDMSELGPR